MRPTVLILPGWTNSGPEHWQSHWERDHPEYRRVAQRDWVHAVRDEWVAALERAVVAADGLVALVAHSLGCHLVAHWAAMYPASAERVNGALLVAPPDPEDPAWPPEIEGFAPAPLAPLPFPSILVASANDPWDPARRGTAFATAWGSRLVDAGAAGHLNTDAGYGPWPVGERLLAALLDGERR
jgi:serine hydrolase